MEGPRSHVSLGWWAAELLDPTMTHQGVMVLVGKRLVVHLVFGLAAVQGDPHRVKQESRCKGQQ